MLLTLLGAAGFILGLVVVVPLLAFGLSALLDRSGRRSSRGQGDEDDGRQGGLRAPRPRGPDGPLSPVARSSTPKGRDGTVS